MMPTTASQQFWAMPEMQLELAKYLNEHDFRKIILTSTQNHKRFLADAWRRVTGIGHLLAILHNDLAVRAIGRARPLVEIPPIKQMDSKRIQRFLLHAAVVQRLKVNSNPNRFILWSRLDRLLELPHLAGRQVVMPEMTHFSIEYHSRYRNLTLAPFIKLCANPWLQQIWVAPNRSQVYPVSSPADTKAVFRALSAFPSSEPELQWLSVYPESLNVDREGRQTLTELFAPLSRSLRFFNTTIWFVSPQLIYSLSEAPLERLEIQGSAPVPFFDVDLINQLELRAGAFSDLRMLLLQNVPLGFAQQLLLSQPLINQVVILRLEICNVIEIDEDEDALYLAVCQRLAAFPRLRELTFSSSRSESAWPYPISMTLLQPLIDKQLELLRLFRISIPNSEGLQSLRYPMIDNWQHLTTLTVMHQDLAADDLIYLTRLPNLIELGGNVSRRLAAPAESPFVDAFVNHLTFKSQYRFRARFRSPMDQPLADAIVSILDRVTQRGMTAICDRLFEKEHPADERDARWARLITHGLKDRGKYVPRPLEWHSAS